MTAITASSLMAMRNQILQQNSALQKAAATGPAATVSGAGATTSRSGPTCCRS